MSGVVCRFIRQFMFAAVLYTIAILMANLTATLFLPFEIAPGTGILVSVGTLVFGITFTQRDRMHSKGRRFVYSVIGISAVLNLLMLLSFRFLWGDWLIRCFSETGLEWLMEAALMLRENGWRVFLASFLAIVIAESADTELFQLYRDRSWMGRVLRSNSVSIPVDSILFNMVAFAGSAFFPAIVLMKVILGEILSKFVVGLLYALLFPVKDRKQED